MSEPLICPHGYPVEPSAVATLAPADQLACPVRGAAVSLISPTVAGNEGVTVPPAPIDAPTVPQPPGFVTLSRISDRALSDRVTVPGCELLSERGRGGMGVVNQARQTRLGRTVALKMILSGGHAGEADLARFKTEQSWRCRPVRPRETESFLIRSHRPPCPPVGPRPRRVD
jgi:hypothetical protein